MVVWNLFKKKKIKLKGLNNPESSVQISQLGGSAQQEQVKTPNLNLKEIENAKLGEYQIKLADIKNKYETELKDNIKKYKEI